MKSYRKTDTEIYNYAISSLQSNKCLKILEIGCSNEDSINFIKKMFPNSKIHGIEYIGWAGEFEKYDNLESLEFLDLNKNTIPHKECSFDLIVCNQVLEHVYEIDNTLNEIYTVLIKKGFFYLRYT